MQVHCPHAERCPGCPLIDLPYDEGLEQKAVRLRRALSAYPTLAGLVPRSIEAATEVTDYRVRAKLVRDGARLGLFARGSHEVVDIPRCPVLRPRLRDVAGALRELIADAPGVSSVDLREVDGGVLVTLAGAPNDGGAIERVAARLVERVPAVLSVARSEREPRGARVLGSRTRVLRGPAMAPHRLEPGGPYHYATPGAFTQLHAGQAAKLYARVLAELEAALGTLSGARVLELYAGSGALALRLGRAGARVTLVENFAPGVALAERAAREQRIPLDARHGDAERLLAAFERTGERFDAVIVNPPRRGLTPEVRRLAARLEPRALVYVSCDPATFARDTDHLARLGFGLRAVTPFDMIPLSDGLELLGSLVAEPPRAPAVLFEDERLVAVSKSPHEPTTPQGEHRSSLLDRVRKLPECARAVPVHRLDVGTSGVCLFARAPEHAAALAAALGRGEKEYVALVRGVSREKGTITRPLKEEGVERDARTRYVRRRVVGGHSLLAVFPQAGRTHQVRRHLAGIGHPVLGDERYADRASNAHFEHRHGLDRPFLHLERVTLELDGTARVLRDELPGDLAAVLESLG